VTTLKRRPRKPTQPDRIVAYAPRGDRNPALEVLRTTRRLIDNPKLAAYLIASEHAEDIRNELAVTKRGRYRAVLERQLRMLEETAAAARRAAGLP
jgi:hypothetical protein